MIYLVIRSIPPILYYQDSDPSYYAEIALRLPLLKSVGHIHRPLNDEAPNVTVSLDNGAGGLTEQFLDPPIGAVASLYRDDTAIFEGSIDSVTIDDDIALGIVA